MPERNYAVKFVVEGAVHYMTILAEHSDDALEIFEKWLLGEEGEDGEDTNSEWRTIYDDNGNMKARFRVSAVARFGYFSE